MEPDRGASEITLRDGCDWSRALRLDLPFGGELVNVPPTTQRFDQLHAARHLLYTEHDRRLLICEQDRLRGKDVQIRIKPGLVAHRRDIDKALCRSDGLLLLLNLLGKQAQGSEVVLGLLERRQDHLLIIRNIGIVERHELSHRRFSQAAIEYGFRRCRSKRPVTAPGRQPILESLRWKSSRSRDA